MNNNHWGTTLLGAVLLLLLAGGLYSWHLAREAARADAIREHETQVRVENEQAERDLRAFAEVHMSELQQLINEIQDEIQIRQRKLDQLAEEMRRMRVVPETDPDFVKWNRAVLELRKKLNVLKEERKNTYLALKKFELDPESKPELDKQRDERLKKARSLAESTREQFNNMRKANQPPEPASLPDLKDKEPEKGKAPAKKRWWIFG
jgi:hypothetical protein